MHIPADDEQPWPPETPTDAPCPPWCQQPHGHPYQLMDHTGLSRLHLARLADLSPWGLTLEVAQIDHVTDPAQNGPPVVTFELSRATGVVAVTGPALRRLAATILDAADNLDAWLPGHGQDIDRRPRPAFPASQAVRDLLELEQLIRAVPAPSPCPDWCQQPTGHPYLTPPAHLPDVHDPREASLPPDRAARVHSRPLADLLPWGLSLTLDQVESLDDTTTPATVHTHPRAAMLITAESPILTGVRPPATLASSDLRSLAQTLVRTADDLHRNLTH